MIDRQEFERATQQRGLADVEELRAALRQAQAQNQELRIQLDAANRGEKPDIVLASRVSELQNELAQCNAQLATSQKIAQGLKQQVSHLELELERCGTSADPVQRVAVGAHLDEEA